ncbi:hypothetical protein ASF28_04790 [Methylobacterium sp. Leaf99]|uniref:hypothetical protein n=1 Tax=Methylobacterium sp. Leaf99 TaxID=1736251 RepID=UPI0006F6B2FA|nr:hypothetical protein [Methylobacterium sp. Leaf99]KQP10451.1 hypothetical protein ASF28_04790 [Methylobacterium sp. Leaf99]
MIIALFALAVLMIVGGIASVVQGFPFVRLESGMAMTVAGATTASAGAVVLGLAAVASHLRGLGRRLGALRPEAPSAETRTAALPPRGPEQDLFEPAPAIPPSTIPTASGLTVGDRPVRQRPSLGGPDAQDFSAQNFGLGAMGATAGLGAAALGAGVAPGAPGAVPHADPLGRGTEPTFALPPDPDLPAPPPPEEIEPPLPDLLPPEDETRTVPDAHAGMLSAEPPPAEPPEPAAVEPPAPENQRTLALFDTDAPGEPVRLYPTLDTMADLTPEPPPAVEEKPEVVGTYASGGNTYVMYANGSIEAETPRGRFSFESLDELKAFVEAGGESDARGAA